MTFEEFVSWLAMLVERGRLTAEQADDLRAQRERFDADRARIEVKFAGRVVGFISEELLVSDGVAELLSVAVGQYDGQRQLYYEPIAPQLSMWRNRVHRELEAE